jgi:1,4-alpha-glucan branching enzyme
MADLSLIEPEVLGAWLVEQRWFASKAREVSAIKVLEAAPLGGDEEPEMALALVEVRFQAGTHELYHLPLGFRHVDEGWSDGVVLQAGDRTVYDAMDDPACARRLMTALGRQAELGDEEHHWRFRLADGGVPVEGELDPIRPVGVEQSNSSTVFGERLILKVYRRIEPGPNPELELLRFLTNHGFHNIARLSGWYEHTGRLVDATLGLVQEFLPDVRDGWELALDGFGHDGGAAFLDEVGRLGEVTAQMHTALGSDPGDPTFAPEEPSAEAIALLVATVDEEIEAVFRDLPTDEKSAPIAGRGQEVREHLRGLAHAGAGGRVVRTHGDYHLGQTLLTDRSWVILDFEGEPARSLPERRQKRSPLRDVAGMLRSFAYAASASELQRGVAAPEDWEVRARGVFLEAYLREVDARLLPHGVDNVHRMLTIFELEKAVYELRYEMNNRPDWMGIPVAGIVRMLETTSMSDLDRCSSATCRSRTPTSAPTRGPDGGSSCARTAPTPSAWPRSSTAASRSTSSRSIPAGVFEGTIPGRRAAAALRPAGRLSPTAARSRSTTPYRFGPTIGDLDLHLVGEGRHEELYETLGAHVREIDGVSGTAFAVWAPSARSVSVVGDFNGWDGRLHPMRSMGPTGVWELFVPGAQQGQRYKYEIRTQDGALQLRADPVAFATEMPPETASVIHRSDYAFSDEDWFVERASRPAHEGPMSVYEVHLGSWRRDPADPERLLSYGELADQLAEYVTDMGFTHVELMPIQAHPFPGLVGLPGDRLLRAHATLRAPDDLKAFVDRMHEHGIGVLLDWVPAHFPRDEFALARFDGTALYEHEDPRRGAHTEWGTLIFNFGRNEVRNFLVANALFWAREYHIDGLRVDAVASMLYLDYSRKQGEWVPNEFGGREDLEAVAFLKELNEVLYADQPGIASVAEESTAWPGVSRPTYVGGLGFGFKWNMGWMHDTLAYFANDPVHRKYHHHSLTFSLVYAFTENFVLPLSHDEVVHGKGSLLTKMPGDRWQQLANVRALFGYMWAHPGKKLLFQGGEFAQEREWNYSQSLDWHLLEDPGHKGVQNLVRDLNRTYRDTPALWERDFDPEGFWWLEPNDADNNVFAFARTSRDGEVVVCVMNLAPVPRRATGSGCPSRAAGASCSTRTPSATAGRTSAASAACRPRPCRGTASRSRPSSPCRRSGSCSSFRSNRSATTSIARRRTLRGDDLRPDPPLAAALDRPGLGRSRSRTDVLAARRGRRGDAGRRPLRPARAARRQRHPPAGGLQVARHRPIDEVRRGAGDAVPLPDPSRRPGDVRAGPRRVHPGHEPRVHRRGRGLGHPLRARRQGRRRVPDPVGDEHELRGRPDPVGHVAVVRGVRLRRGLAVRSDQALAGGPPAGARAVRARGRLRRSRGPAPVPHRGQEPGRLLPLHPGLLPGPHRRAPRGRGAGRRRPGGVGRRPEPAAAAGAAGDARAGARRRGVPARRGDVVRLGDRLHRHDARLEDPRLRHAHGAHRGDLRPREAGRPAAHPARQHHGLAVG